MNAHAMFDSTAATIMPAGPAADPAGMLASKAMLVTLSISGWSARKLDREITDETNERHGASVDAGRYNKRLISADALTAIGKVAGAARTFHYSRTLPWQDSGGRVLLAAGYPDYADNMRAFRLEHEDLASVLVRIYPTLVDAAQHELGDMFRPGDYPSAADVARKFGFSVAVDPIPQTADFRVDVGDSARAIISAEIQDRTQQLIGAAMRDVYGRVAAAVGAMASKLSDYKPGVTGERESGGFKSSLIGNISELVALLPTLNLTGDPALTAVGDRMLSELCRYEFRQLKEDEFARDATRDAAADILATVNEFLS